MTDETARKWASGIAENTEVKLSAHQMASEANYSKAQYYRRFQRQLGESPLRLRRRLLLERSAYELTRTELTIFDIGIHAGFEAGETFTRSFRKNFGVSPSAFRRLGASNYRLPTQSAIHYAPAKPSDDSQQGEFTMNILDRLIGAHYEGMKLILNRCEGLSELELDQPVAGYYDPLPWMSQTQSLRSLLQLTTGASDAPTTSLTIRDLRETLDRSNKELVETVTTYEREKMWDMTFVDADCDPPMVFSYGGWIGHVATFLSYRRIACMMALAQLGKDPGKFFDPIDVQGPALEGV